MTTPTNECLDCIDGMAMDYMPNIGTCFRVCLTCQPTCACCHGLGRWPAWTRDMAEFILAYNAQGLLPVLCHTCGGYLDSVPLDDGGRPQ